MATSLPLSISDVRAAARRVEGAVTRTPLVTSRTLDALTGAHVVAKAENLQRTGSFKVRGAWNRLALLPPEERPRGVVAYSSGNHAQAVALAGRELGVPVTVVMPSDAPASKRAATEGYGARVVPYDRASESREEVAARVADESGAAALVPPYDDLAVMAGQGTAALELLEDGPVPDVVVVPLGGGGLLSGWATAVRDAVPGARIVGVETVGADDWVRSRAAGRPVAIDPPATIADGIRTLSPGALTWPVVDALVDDVVVVRDEDVVEALRLVVGRLKLVVEPTGAVALAALLTGAAGPVAGRTVATVLCGGNVDLPALAALLG
ncbi:pyridoxal-phosphate dependent enzyme [Vallicoccus soli]|uniref:threonine ammonia-lyase n=1 Tax=Vallicoccus soli TaxID=2339232 RepID=A0A3A3Z455_9ACTN|nr:pyridoxal-phosphate dependent enzyme [Vallicoccus soli]RJK97708.1 pyridoxal-phosphate dependent enzyme [Vallicoccus soli]